MAAYSAIDKLLHKFYLGNYSIAKATLEIEESLFAQKSKKVNAKEYVFVTGLARSGTTAVMNKIFNTGEYASLQYSNMPFLLSPNLWKRKSRIESHERAHKDGIIIDGNSPEEFDEFFWKAFLKDSYIREKGLVIHEVNDKLLEKYLSYIQLICFAKERDKYISKNNNNILRLDTLQKIQNGKIIMLFRDPLSHASSLMKLDKSFSRNQEEDTFSLDYFNYLGHHEFGLNHKPFLLTDEFASHRENFPKESLNYWLAIWLNYYRYVLNQTNNNIILICFEDLISRPNMVYEYIGKELEVNTLLSHSDLKKHKPTNYSPTGYDQNLLEKCLNVYKSLLELQPHEFSQSSI